jgi:crossover junction endodeoxyribonuclease RuvC
MKIIALDPGYDRCGLAVIERVDNGKEVLVDSMCISTNKKDPFEKRLVIVAQKFREWAVLHKPTICVLENLFFATNQKTAMRVAEMRGALILVVSEFGIPIHEFTPKQVKIAVTGDGGASKKQVMMMIPKLIHLNKEILLDDEYDAIAVGLTASASFSSIFSSVDYPHQ